VSAVQSESELAQCGKCEWLAQAVRKVRVVSASGAESASGLAQAVRRVRVS
jgi:hypothetical protein